MDWDEAQEEEYDDSEGRYDREGASDEYDEPRPRRRHAPPREGKRRERLTLMELCTPVFGYAAVLPRDAGGIQPGYQQFRQEVLNALQRIESEAPQHGIEREDATKAAYALSLFMDEQVGESEWTGKMQWIGEPLSIMKLQDPEGGINFFNILDSLGERQKAVKEVFLVCLSLGFRGKYAEIEDITQQSARIAEVRQKVLRTIHPSPLESRRLLFPEAYTEAIPLEDEAPPPPRWWVAASMATVAVCVLIYVLLFWSAINAPNSADAALKKVLAGEVSQ
jgi:type VI secretion system protein ImpK